MDDFVRNLWLAGHRLRIHRFQSAFLVIAVLENPIVPLPAGSVTLSHSEFFVSLASDVHSRATLALEVPGPTPLLKEEGWTRQQERCREATFNGADGVVTHDETLRHADHRYVSRYRAHASRPSAAPRSATAEARSHNYKVGFVAFFLNAAATPPVPGGELPASDAVWATRPLRPPSNTKKFSFELERDRKARAYVPAELLFPEFKQRRY
jgi:hypothetical protein